MRRIPFVLAFAGVAALSGCRVESALNPNDPVKVTGSALNEDKSPLQGDVKLYRDSTSTCVIPGEFATLTTDSTGAFSKELTGADTQLNNVARCFRAALPAGEKGSRVYADFLMQVTDVMIPTLQRWTGKVAASAAGDGADFTFEPLTQTQSQFSGVTYTAQLTTTSGTAWSKTEATSPVTFDKYMMEDFADPKALAWSTPDYKGSGTTFHFLIQTDSVALPLKTLVPVSRGATCAYNKAPATACPLTDGQLSAVLFDTAPTVTITLPTARTIKHVVVRGLRAPAAAAVTLEGSTDGTTFTSLVELNLREFQSVDVPGSTPYATFRLKTNNASVNLVGLNEISLFE